MKSYFKRGLISIIVQQQQHGFGVGWERAAVNWIELECWPEEWKIEYEMKEVNHREPNICISRVEIRMLAIFKSNNPSAQNYRKSNIIKISRQIHLVRFQAKIIYTIVACFLAAHTYTTHIAFNHIFSDSSSFFLTVPPSEQTLGHWRNWLSSAHCMCQATSSHYCRFIFQLNVISRADYKCSLVCASSSSSNGGSEIQRVQQRTKISCKLFTWSIAINFCSSLYRP